MSGRLILPGVNNGPGEFAKAINRVVKQFRGKSRPFLTLMVEENGNVTVLSNMDVHSERIKLLKEVHDKLRGN
jgi:hypothetical protein